MMVRSHYTILYCDLLHGTDVVIGFDPVRYTVAEETGTAEVTVRIISGTLANNVVVLLNTASGTTMSKLLHH